MVVVPTVKTGAAHAPSPRKKLPDEGEPVAEIPPTGRPEAFARPRDAGVPVAFVSVRDDGVPPAPLNNTGAPALPTLS